MDETTSPSPFAPRATVVELSSRASATICPLAASAAIASNR